MTNRSQWQTFKRLMSYLKSYKWMAAFALVLLLLSTVVKSLIPLLASHFIDSYIEHINTTGFSILIGYYFMYVLQSVIEYFGNLYFAKVSYSIVKDIRCDAFSNMERLGMSYFDKTPTRRFNCFSNNK